MRHLLQWTAAADSGQLSSEHPLVIALKTTVEVAAEAITRAGLFPSLPPISIVCYGGNLRKGGYTPETRGEHDLIVPRCISISIDGVSPLLTFAHEWGHYVDNALTGFSEYGSPLEVIAEIEQTEAVKTLRMTMQNEANRLSARRLEALRLLDKVELWARAYAQYVALRSENANMIEEVAVRRASPNETFPELEYWTWSDFERITQVLDRFKQDIRMVAVTEDEVIAARIEEILRCRPWHGVVSVEIAISNAIAYRNALTGTHQQMFDDAMREGLLPERAIEMIDYAVKQGLIPDEENSPTLARAS